MKKILVMAVVASLAVGLAGCLGNSSVDNEASGQVKRVHLVTPLICNDRTDADISLGVMHNGQGSMSTQDMWLTVGDPALIPVLKQAADSGAIVKFKYNVARMRWCWNEEEITSVEILK